MTVVKICGITDLTNGLAAIEAGAAYLGFVFYPPSPRAIDTAAAAKLIAELRARTAATWEAVGVFVNEPLEVVEETRRVCQLDVVQLNGDETLAYIEQIDAPVFKAIRGLRPAGESLPTPADFGAHRLLVDANVPGQYGGTGMTIDWERVRPMVGDGLLAGGLTPDNVHRAIQVARPWGLDVSSGVETNGVKDANLIRRFIENALAVSV
jgi:phosphoribosylanthranilate isomerase